MRILSGYQSTRKLEGILNLDENAIHHRNRPQEPHVLEVPEEVEQQDGPLA